MVVMELLPSTGCWPRAAAAARFPRLMGMMTMMMGIKGGGEAGTWHWAGQTGDCSAEEGWGLLQFWMFPTGLMNDVFGIGNTRIPWEFCWGKIMLDLLFFHLINL
jgi:hypothetical protein